ncbi:putative small proline-rich protein 5 [Physeter macrocephalus]|uniref:Small proline-rich protein 5 n=1 Tax=Physeter macrocephalus TaxID=9755 RepID=A0A9W2WMA4_PHYMC|nr:putative small proline-rich protein 5 [Physeter catodon]
MVSKRDWRRIKGVQSQSIPKPQHLHVPATGELGAHPDQNVSSKAEAVLPPTKVLLPRTPAVLPPTKVLLPCTPAILPTTKVLLPRTSAVLSPSEVLLPPTKAVLDPPQHAGQPCQSPPTCKVPCVPKCQHKCPRLPQCPMSKQKYSLAKGPEASLPGEQRP